MEKKGMLESVKKGWYKIEAKWALLKEYKLFFKQIPQFNALWAKKVAFKINMSHGVHKTAKKVSSSIRMASYTSMNVLWL